MNAWPHVRHLFVTDDGSLPEIFIKGLTDNETVDVYNCLMQQCHIYDNPVVWSFETERDVVIRELRNPARAFVERKIESFRHGLADLSINGVPLLNITVCVGENGLSFDYRMGKEWSEVSVNALFELLRQIRIQAPEAQIFQADEGMYEKPNIEFSEAFDQYVKSLM